MGFDRATSNEASTRVANGVGIGEPKRQDAHDAPSCPLLKFITTEASGSPLWVAALLVFLRAADHKFILTSAPSHYTVSALILRAADHKFFLTSAHSHYTTVSAELTVWSDANQKIQKERLKKKERGKKTKKVK